MVTILLERREFIRATHFPSADLFLGCSLAMVLVDNLLPLTALSLKGQSDCEIPAAADTNSCERLYQALFWRATDVREYESDAKIRPDRRLRQL